MLHYPENVKAAMRDGKLWRAKEILQGRLAGSSFDADLYEQYGAVQLQMGDLPAAGKYLYLSGKRLPEYEAAIDIFLTRNGQLNWEAFVATFPRGARKLPLADFPPAVREHLRGKGVPDAPPRVRKSSGPLIFGSTALAAIAVISMVVGFIVILRYLFGLYESIWS